MTEHSRTILLRGSKKLKECEAIVAKISHLRDDLRSKVDDLNEILECADTAIDDFENASRMIQDAIDKLSEQL